MHIRNSRNIINISCFVLLQDYILNKQHQLMMHFIYIHIMLYYRSWRQRQRKSFNACCCFTTFSRCYIILCYIHLKDWIRQIVCLLKLLDKLFLCTKHTHPLWIIRRKNSKLFKEFMSYFVLSNYFI